MSSIVQSIYHVLRIEVGTSVPSDLGKFTRPIRLDEKQAIDRIFTVDLEIKESSEIQIHKSFISPHKRYTVFAGDHTYFVYCYHGIEEDGRFFMLTEIQ